jgi:hypothetical protein
MAKIHGEAGRYCKQSAFHEWKRGFARPLLIAFVALFVGGMCIGGGFRYFWWLGFMGVGVMYWAKQAIERSCQRYDDTSRRNRRNHLRGAEAEEVVALELADLPDSFHVFNGLILDGRANPSAERDIDHIVVGPTGVWALSTKGHKGLYQIRGNQHFLNGAPHPFASRAREDAADLHELLKGKLKSRVPWVQAAIVLPFAWVEGDNLRCNPMVLTSDQLLDELDREKPRQTLNRNEIELVVQALDAVSVSRSLKKAGATPAPTPAT